LVSGVRQCKDADEIILMTRNAELVRQVLEAAAPAARAGVSERDIWAKIEAGLRAEPSRGLQLLGNCASGLRTVGGDPHASDRILQPGDPLLLDVYPRIDGYFADLTRTWFCGEPSPVLGRMVDAVTDALHRTAALLRPGVAGSDLDSEARAILEGHGYPRAYPHHTGHGLGVKQQERPWIRPRSADVIPEGAIVALEPACYVEGVGGVRLEDEYLVTAEGARPLGELAGAETRR
jgi:Xaa-Pro aminopeptidase